MTRDLRPGEVFTIGGVPVTIVPGVHRGTYRLVYARDGEDLDGPIVEGAEDVRRRAEQWLQARRRGR